MRTKKVYIFVPGYYGTTLIEPASGRLIWGDPKEVLLSRRSLALPIPGMRVPGALELRPHQMINTVSILGGLLKEEAYDKTVALLKTLDPAAIFPVAWDWRREPLHGVQKIDETVRLAKLQFPGSELVLVSHSFGSLISSYYLRYGVQDYSSEIETPPQTKETWEGLEHFSKVVLTAAPFRGLMAMFRNILNGFRFGLNTNLQTPLAFSSFESSYYLLPPPGLDRVLNEDLQSISLGLHDPQLWPQNRWGLFQEKLKLPDSTFEARLNYTQHHLNRARQFHRLVDAPLAKKPTTKPLLYLWGTGSKTVHHGVWLDRHADPNIFLYYARDFKKWRRKISHEIVYGDGDQTIPSFSAVLPQALQDLGAQIIQTSHSHLEVLQHPSSQKIIFEFLNQNSLNQNSLNQNSLNQNSLNQNSLEADLVAPRIRPKNLLTPKCPETLEC